MKLLFTDLDGTLLNAESKISENTKIFLEKFISDGNRLILSSGRPLASVEEVLCDASLPIKGIYMICNNGTLIYDYEHKTSILEKRLPFDYVSYLQQKAVEFGVHIHTYTDDSVVSMTEDSEVRFYRKRIHIPLILADDFAAYLKKGPFKMLAIDLDSHARLEKFRASLADWAEGRIQAIFSNDHYLELFDHTAGKGNAVEYLCKYLGVRLSDTYAAGDAENDISMLKAAGCGIAMANATDTVKAVADVVTDFDNAHDGLALMMEKLLASET